MKRRQIIAINGSLYEYVGYDEKLDYHTVSGIDIDDRGNLTNTHILHGFTTEELADNKADFSTSQWLGIVETFLRQDYSFSDEDINTIVDDIVCRCFTYGIPTIEELPQYIAEYLDR